MLQLRQDAWDNRGLIAILKKVFDKTINNIAIMGLKTFEAMEQAWEYSTRDIRS